MRPLSSRKKQCAFWSGFCWSMAQSCSEEKQATQFELVNRISATFNNCHPCPFTPVLKELQPFGYLRLLLKINHQTLSFSQCFRQFFEGGGGVLPLQLKAAGHLWKSCVKATEPEQLSQRRYSNRFGQTELNACYHVSPLSQTNSMKTCVCLWCTMKLGLDCNSNEISGVEKCTFKQRRPSWPAESNRATSGEKIKWSSLVDGESLSRELEGCLRLQKGSFGMSLVLLAHQAAELILQQAAWFCWRCRMGAVKPMKWPDTRMWAWRLCPSPLVLCIATMALCQDWKPWKIRARICRQERIGLFLAENDSYCTSDKGFKCQLEKESKEMWVFLSIFWLFTGLFVLKRFKQ